MRRSRNASFQNNFKNPFLYFVFRRLSIVAHHPLLSIIRATLLDGLYSNNTSEHFCTVSALLKWINEQATSYWRSGFVTILTLLVSKTVCNIISTWDYHEQATLGSRRIFTSGIINYNRDPTIILDYIYMSGNNVDWNLEWNPRKIIRKSHDDI